MIFLLVCVGCSSANTQNTEIQQEAINFKIYKDDIYMLYPKDVSSVIRDYDNEYGGMIDDLIGTVFPTYNFETLSGEKIQLSKDGYIFEVATSQCPHCKNLSKEAMPSILENANVAVYQYFYDGDKENIKDFYQDIEKDIPDNLTVFKQNKALNAWLAEHNLDLSPILIYVDGDGYIKLLIEGFNNAAATLSVTDKIASVSLSSNAINEDISIIEFIGRQKKVEEYMKDMDEIVLPSDFFE